LAGRYRSAKFVTSSPQKQRDPASFMCHTVLKHTKSTLGGEMLRLGYCMTKVKSVHPISTDSQ
jgi:hypothetical protein